MLLKNFNVVRPTITVDAAKDADHLGQRRLMVCQVTAVSSQRACAGTAMFARKHHSRYDMQRPSWLTMALIDVNLYEPQHHSQHITSHLVAYYGTHRREPL